jgi:hypothetical protein
MGYLENRVGRFKAPPGSTPKDYYIIPFSVIIDSVEFWLKHKRITLIELENIVKL